MTKNPILDELRETREKLLAEAGGTMEGLVARLQQAERQSDREIVRLKNRINPATGVVTPDVLEMGNESSLPG